MKLIVGLGNPGSQYARTRHNVGFMVLEQLATDLSASWKPESKLKSEVALADLAGERVILAKPQTFMNLSGEAVQRILQFYKLDPTEVWVVFDDVDVPFGRLRLRAGGSSSGHQGVKSLIQHVGPDFLRARVGISLNDRTKEPSEEYVLKPFSTEEREELPLVIERAAAIIQHQLQLETPEESTFDLL